MRVSTRLRASLLVLGFGALTIGLIGIVNMGATQPTLASVISGVGLLATWYILGVRKSAAFAWATFSGTVALFVSGFSYREMQWPLVGVHVIVASIFLFVLALPSCISEYQANTRSSTSVLVPIAVLLVGIGAALCAQSAGVLGAAGVFALVVVLYLLARRYDTARPAA